MILVDAETGLEADPIVVDRNTARPVDGPDFVFTAGPAASAAFTDRYSASGARRSRPVPSRRSRP